MMSGKIVSTKSILVVCLNRVNSLFSGVINLIKLDIIIGSPNAANVIIARSYRNRSIKAIPRDIER